MCLLSKVSVMSPKNGLSFDNKYKSLIKLAVPLVTVRSSLGFHLIQVHFFGDNKFELQIFGLYQVSYMFLLSLNYKIKSFGLKWHI